jgi:hemolysin activation/secretion protein
MNRPKLLGLLSGLNAACLALQVPVPCEARDINPGTLNPGVLQRQYSPPIPNQAQPNPDSPKPKVEENQQQLPQDGGIKILISKILFEGNTKVSTKDLDGVVKASLGKKLSFAEIEKLVNDVTTYYRSRGYFISQALLPKQDISSGTLIIQIVEGYVEKIEIESPSKNSLPQDPSQPNSSTKKAGALEQWLLDFMAPVAKIKPLTIDALERQLLLAKAYAAVDLTTTLSAGSQKGGSVLQMRVVPSRVQYSLSADNWVPQQLGSLRTSASVYGTPVLGVPIGMAASGSYTWPYDAGFVNAYYSASAPLGNRGFSTSLAYSYTLTNSGPIQTLGPDFTTTTGGSSNYLSLALRYPLKQQRRQTIVASTQFDFLNSTNNTFANNLEVTNSIANLRTLRFKLEANREGKLSSSQASLQLSQGINVFNGQNQLTLTGFDPAQNYGNLNFTTSQLTLSHQQRLSEQLPLQLSLRATGQISAGPTPSAEQIGFGGSTYGRGLRSVQILGDQGIMGIAELSHSFAAAPVKLLFQPYLFADAGETMFRSGNAPSQYAATTGLGLRVFALSSGWLNADVGWGIPFASNTAAVATGVNNSIVYFRATVNF